jgi:hypothetical protein
MERFEEMHAQEEAIIRGNEKPKNRGEVQMLLATNLYEYMFGKADSHHDIMDYWISDGNPEGFATQFAKLEKDPLFINHPRLKGDISKITVEDILQYKQEESLPE